MEDGLTLDAGALIAIERGDDDVREVTDRVIAQGRPVQVPPGVLAQVWRGGPRQARLAQFLALEEVDLLDLDPETAKVIGLVIGRTGHADVVDVHVALNARLNRHAVVTSDPDDIRAVDPGLTIIEV